MSNLPRLLRHHQTTLAKTATYYAMHMVVAASVAYAVTGQWWAALALSVIEPAVQAVAYGLHDRAWARVPWQRARTLLKTLSYYLVHLGVAAAVVWAVTGDVWMALTLSLLEPTVQMLFYYLHETYWERRLAARTAAAAAPDGWTAV